MTWFILRKTLRSSAPRLMMVAAAIMVGMVTVLSFVAGVNALTKPALPLNYALTGQGQEPRAGVEPVRVNSDILPTAQTDDGVPTGWIQAYQFYAPSASSPTLPEMGELAPGELWLSPTAKAWLDEQLKNPPKPLLGNPDPDHIREGALGTFDLLSGLTYKGLIPEDDLSAPDSMVAFYGADEADFKATETFYTLGSGEEVSAALEIYTFDLDPVQVERDQTSGGQKFFLDMFKLIGALCLIFPILLFISVSSTLGAKQKEARYAALRLIGATKRQVTQMLVLETTLGVALGIAFGIAVYWPLHFVEVQNFQLGGEHYWEHDFRPTLGQYVLLSLGVLAFAIAVNLLSQRKVNISPLGVSKNQRSEKNPRLVRLLPIMLSLGVYVYLLSPAAHALGSEPKMLGFMASFAVLLFSLILAGPYLTFLIARIWARFASRPIGFLTAKRLAHSPKMIFRSVSGIVIAMFVGSFFITLVETAGKLVAQSPIIKDLLQLVYIGIGITIFVTLFSLIVSTIGGILERKDSLFTLYLSGTSRSEINRLILSESLIPMFFAVLGSTGAGVASALTMWTISGEASATAASVQANPPVILPVIVLIVLALSVAVIACALPTLKRTLSIEHRE